MATPLLFFVFFTVFFLPLLHPQKIFVMPNMDDVWLQIMHSAMDARSNLSPAAAAAEAAKEAEPPEPDDLAAAGM